MWNTYFNNNYVELVNTDAVLSYINEISSNSLSSIFFTPS